MASYVVYTRQGLTEDDVVFVKDAFSWGAFLFSVFWCLWHRMWIAAAALLIVLGIISLAAGLSGAGELVESLATLAVALIFGLEASEMRRLSLLHGGYREAAFISGSNIEEAEIRYFASAGTGNPPSSQPAAKMQPQASHDPLGLFGPA
jgi:hypothetical protein